MDIYDQAKKVSSQQEFIEFLKSLRRDFSENPNDWENNDLISFLEGIEGYILDIPQEKPSWEVFAKILLAAKVYE